MSWFSKFVADSAPAVHKAVDAVESIPQEVRDLIKKAADRLHKPGHIVTVETSGHLEPVGSPGTGSLQITMSSTPVASIPAPAPEVTEEPPAAA